MYTHTYISIYICVYNNNNDNNTTTTNNNDNNNNNNNNNNSTNNSDNIPQARAAPAAQETLDRRGRRSPPCHIIYNCIIHTYTYDTYIYIYIV